MNITAARTSQENVNTQSATEITYLAPFKLPGTWISYLAFREFALHWNNSPQDIKTYFSLIPAATFGGCVSGVTFPFVSQSSFHNSTLDQNRLFTRLEILTSSQKGFRNHGFCWFWGVRSCIFVCVSSLILRPLRTTRLALLTTNCSSWQYSRLLDPTSIFLTLQWYFRSVTYLLDPTPNFLNLYWY